MGLHVNHHLSMTTVRASSYISTVILALDTCFDGEYANVVGGCKYGYEGLVERV